MLTCSSAPAQNLQREQADFFSYKRFFLNQRVVDSIRADGRIKKDLKIFAHDFTDGIYELSAENMPAAEKALLRARRIWPEYFGTDFLLALVYEKQEKYNTAARYYKSYLNKLKGFHAGKYRISGPIIRSFSPGGIERYESARELVRERLALYGIDLDKARPVFTPPDFVLPFIFIFVIITAFFVIQYKILPYFKRQQRINNPPEGFWICRHCGTANPDLRKECAECGRPRE